ncbi:MAG: type 1 glutamine amidotransferase [Proteobacteria bacterium]|nr:MAG: type 1 glutamine amidotransferase [Pseudomonadota bacterium]
MKKQILLIDNTFDPPHGSPEIRDYLEQIAKELGLEIEVTAARAPEGGIPADLSRFQGAVLSGSKTRIDEQAPWIEKEMAAIRELHAKKIPTFAICYGEQLIAKTFGADAGRHDITGVAKEMEHGWAEIEVIADSPILSGLPKKFFSFQNHKDAVRELPANFKLSATNAACAVQAYELTDAPMWGVQFHPERGFDEGNRALDNRLKENPAYPALNRANAKDVYNPAVGATMFRNFLKWIAKNG